MAAGCPLLRQGLQQEEQTVEGQQEESSLIVKKQEGVRVFLSVWEDPGETVNTQLIGHIPHTQNLEGKRTALH